MVASLVVGTATVAAAVVPASVASAIPPDTVTNCSGSASTVNSLPYRVANAVAGATIDFSVSCPATNPITPSGTLDIGVNLTINGLGPTETVVSGNNAVTVFDVGSGVTNAKVSGLTIEDANSSSGGGITSGGGVFNGGTLNITDSTLSGNSATTSGCTSICEADGGGIYNGGNLTITDSTLSGNTATTSGCTSICEADGGGIYNGGNLTITDSTLSGNTASLSGCTTFCFADGGGVFNGGTLTITNSTLSGNSASTSGCTFDCVADGGGIDNQGGNLTVGATIVANSTGGNCYGTVTTDLGYNLEDDAGASCGFSSTDNDIVGENPDLGPLQNNGGPTDTMALLAGSPAIDKVPAPDCPATDQRGAPRKAPCDIGAYDTDFANFSVICAPGTSAHFLTATYATGNFYGIFCVNPAGSGTYTQLTATGTISGVGVIITEYGITWIYGTGPGVVLSGHLQGTNSTFTETKPAPRTTGTFTLSPPFPPNRLF